MNKSCCFVCQKSFPKEKMDMNTEVFLPVCFNCKGTEKEKKMAEEYLDSLAEGFTCGCI